MEHGVHQTRSTVPETVGGYPPISFVDLLDDFQDDSVLLLKTSSEELENPRQKNSGVKSQSEEADEMMKLLGVTPLLTLDTLGGVSKRLGVKLPYRAMP